MLTLVHAQDIQELFGHATSLLLSTTAGGGWDMLDILGVAMNLHPELANHQKHAAASDNVMRMLPICACFACGNVADRLDGCDKCQSEFYEQAIAHYVANQEGYVGAFSVYTLKRAASKIAVKRASVRAMIETIAGPLMLHLPSFPPHIYEKSVPLIVDEYNEWVSDLIFAPDDVAYRRVIAALVGLNRPEADSVAELIARSRTRT